MWTSCQELPRAGNLYFLIRVLLFRVGFGKNVWLLVSCLGGWFMARQEQQQHQQTPAPASPPPEAAAAADAAAIQQQEQQEQ
jgi:hypothetical protein